MNTLPRHASASLQLQQDGFTDPGTSHSLRFRAVLSYTVEAWVNPASTAGSQAVITDAYQINVSADPTLLAYYDFINMLSVRTTGATTIVLHPAPRGDIEVFRVPAAQDDSLAQWWQLIHAVATAISRALRVLPAIRVIATTLASRARAIVSAKMAAMTVLQGLIAAPIVVSAAVGAMKAIYQQGQLWPLLESVFANAGW